ncbi:MAG TPA: glutathione S-transferase [Capillimicrobium sp.]
MPARPKLYALPASHPCETVEEALRLKGLEYDRVDLVPVAHAPFQLAVFGKRTVPAVRFADGTKVAGSRAILRELDRIAPEPALLPADPALRARVEDAERWGDDVLQPIGRRLAWAAFRRRSDLMTGYADGRLPLPDPAVRAAGPLVAAIAGRVNGASDEAAAADLAALPGHLDRVDTLIAEGVLDGERANAADLQIGAGVRILLTFGDVEPLVAGRPAEAHARRFFPRYAGHVPAGVLPG